MPVNRRPGSPNSLFSEDEFGLADVGKLIKDLNREPAALREMRMRLERAQTSIAAINQLETSRPGSLKNPAFSKALLTNQRTEAALAPRIGLYEATRQERTSAQAVNSVGRELSESSVNSYVSRNLNSMNMQGGGFATASSTSYSELRKRQESIRGEMGRVRARALNSAENLYDEQGNVDTGAVKKMHKSQVRFKGLANELTSVSASLNQAKHEGKDPQSRLLALTRAQGNASGVLNTNNIEEQMKGGTGLGALSQKDLKQKETEASLKLIKAMEDLRKSFGKGEEVVEKFADKAEEAAKELEDVQEAQGMGGGGGGNKYDNIKTIVGAVQEALSVITNGYQNVAINQPMQMVSNIQGTANLENEKYNMWHSALNGDMSARMNLGGWAGAEQFGQQQFDRQGIVHGGRIVTNTLGGALGVVQAGVGVAQAMGGVADVVGVNPVENIAQGAKSAISGAVGVIEESTALARHTEQTRLRVDATHAMMGATKAINHVPGQQLQKYRDYAMGINAAADQMGGAGGEAFLEEAGGTDFLARMKTQGVGLKEMGALSAQGASQMGSMFKSSQVLDAVGLENLGHGAAADNMRRMGALGAAGTQDPSSNLQKIIEEGMQRGLDSSKAIDMMVENTARMTEENAQRGGMTDPTEFLTRTIMGAVDRNNPNKEMAGQIAYQTYQSGEAARSNISASFPGMINVARVTRAAGLESDQAAGLMMTQMSSTMLNSHEKDSKEDFKSFLEQRGMRRSTIEGLGEQLNDPAKYIQGINAAKSVSELSQKSGLSMVSGLPGKMVEEILKNKDNPEVLEQLRHLKDPSKLPNELRDLRAPIAEALSTAGQNPDAVFSDVIANLGIKLPKENANTLATEAERNKNRGNAQFERRGGNQAEDEQARLGGAGLAVNAGGANGSGGNSLAGLADSLRTAFQKAGENAEEAWTTAAAKAAGSFGASTKSLNHASGQLDIAATALATNAGQMGVISKGFGTMIEQWTKDIKRTTDEVVNKLRSKL